jgi:hypothetical protein
MKLTLIASAAASLAVTLTGCVAVPVHEPVVYGPPPPPIVVVRPAYGYHHHYYHHHRPYWRRGWR